MRGRSVTIWERLYIDGYDMSGYTLDCGERGIEFELGESFCLSDTVRGVVTGQALPTFGPVNGVFDNTATSGIHVLANAARGTRRYIMHARGVQAAPAIGDDAFCATMLQMVYKANQGENMITCTLEFAFDATLALNYGQHFGALLHPLAAETGANSANTNHDNGAATTGGGWLMYQIRTITGGAGTATVSVDDSANGASWLALSGATSGAIAYSAAPIAGIVQLGTTATVRQYLRWQLALAGGATGATFALAFMRG